jgi:hypothetical protein
MEESSRELTGHLETRIVLEQGKAGASKDFRKLV